MCNEGHNKILLSKLDDRPLSAGILMFGLCVLFFQSGCRDAKIIYANLICHSWGGGVRTQSCRWSTWTKATLSFFEIKRTNCSPTIVSSLQTSRNNKRDAEDLFSLWICLHRKKSVWSTLPIILCRFQWWTVLLPVNSMYLYTIFGFKGTMKGQDEHWGGLFQL